MPVPGTIQKVISAILFCSCLFFHQYGLSQSNYTMNWCFVEQQKLNFSGGTAVVQGSSALSGWGEGCAAISDKNTGQLLFYSDGNTVYNRLDNIMQNGSGLLGNVSSTQSTLIVPVPCDSSKYYLFSTYDNGSVGTYYSIIDMTLDGGLGAITAIKNVSINSHAAEKMAGTIHSNGIDYWVLTTNEYNNGFEAFRVTANGVMPAVLSFLGTTNAGERTAGQMKISPDGKRISKAYYGWAGSTATPLPLGEVYDFNNATGQVSNAISLNLPGFDRGYGTEFSPNNKIVYFTADRFIINPHQFVFQFDLSVFDSVAINNSRLIVDSGNLNKSCMQLGADGKIYIPNQRDLDVIGNPNQPGLTCNYIRNGLALPAHTFGWVSWGLPNFVSSFFNPNAPAGNCAVIPLRLISFMGRLKNQVRLNWYGKQKMK